MPKSSRSAANSALAAWQTSLAAATTIAVRTPILFTAAMTGSPKAVRESQRMVTEKANAAVHGAIAAGQAWAQMWLRMSTGAMRPDELGRIMDAAVAPAQRTCKANARRLSRMTKKRRG